MEDMHYLKKHAWGKHEWKNIKNCVWTPCLEHFPAEKVSWLIFDSLKNTTVCSAVNSPCKMQKFYKSITNFINYKSILKRF